MDFDVTYITKNTKPDWFVEISPHSKVPVLEVDGNALFESNAIVEYLDEVITPRLAPEHPFERARNRAWTDFTGSWAGALGKVNYAKTEQAHIAAMKELPITLQKIEDALNGRVNKGPYFNNDQLCLVDAAYAPFLMRFDIVERINPTCILDDFPHIRAWSSALLTNEAVINSVSDDFVEIFKDNLKQRKTLAAQIMNS